LAIPVTGNGDVADAAGLAERAAGDCDGVMVGRSAVRAPWIFADARAREAGLPPGPDIDLEAVAERFFELLAKRQPPEFWETRARRWLRYFSDNFKWAHHVRTLTGREGGLSGMMAALRRHLAENPEERWLKRGAPAAGGEAGGMAAASGAD
jgi:tRNA-dihydrouridine synthase